MISGDQLKASQSKLEESSWDGFLTAMSLPEDEGEARHHAFNAIYNGTQSQVGLPIRPSALALDMEPFQGKDGLLMYKSNRKGFEDSSFYPYQVSGAATCLVGMLGYIPVSEQATQDVKNAAESLKGLQIGGKFICDQTGLGKTILLLIIIAYAENHVMRNEKG
ncbi:hypothetical protein DM02DRAFT_656202 [Periconia macrospinosa]|uniref:SNF2 N-terminal domain-containing protein n=1 Tax=Periconia macrospinosa TaxID=97972 RepID=A0A2V1DND4_9PLEO|nr:hypothetical protein DM02DRAFT_656202 [Periconia macrospinosa]